MVKLNIIETPLKIISPVRGTTKKPPDWWLLQKNERARPPKEGVVGLGLRVGYWCSYSFFCSLLKWILLQCNMKYCFSKCVFIIYIINSN